EGRSDNQGLGRFQPIGDFNGDGVTDYLVTSDAGGGDGYVFFGPLTADQLYRVDTRADIDPSTYPDDLRVRGNHWSFNVSIQDDTEQQTAADTYRVGGQAQLRTDGASLGTPAVRSGNITGDTKDDLIFTSLS